MSRRMRVAYIVNNFPQVSQTYIRSEIEAVADRYDVSVLSRGTPKAPYRHHHAYRMTPTESDVFDAIEDIRPDVLHTHWVRGAPMAAAVADRYGIPFTVRTHSFDVAELGRHRDTSLTRPRLKRAQWQRHRDGLRALSSPWCVAVLAFPYAMSTLAGEGVREDLLVESWPVVNYRRFLDRSPNDRGILSTGAALPKKGFHQCVTLAGMMPDLPFRLYPMFDDVGLEQRNREAGSPLEIVPSVEPDEMAAEYKRHDWFVYTVDAAVNTVGWPMSVAEAQASGCGVCVQRLRPDLETYVGRASGVLFDDVRELVDIVREPPPLAMREAGFVQAAKSDIAEHVVSVTDVWDRLAAGRLTAG